MYQLRQIVRIVSLVVALPLLGLGRWPDPLRGTFITEAFPHSALALFLVTVALGSGMFLWINRQAAANRRTYVLSGLALGLFPAIFFTVVCAVRHQLYPPVLIAVIGVFTGVIGGVVLWREYRSAHPH